VKLTDVKTNDVAIIDSGGANIASLQFALRRLGHGAEITSDARKIRQARRVILPGVGAAANAMDRLRVHDLVDVIRGLSQPVLGVCLGMQLLAEASEEDDVECLGIISGVARKLPGSPQQPVPNMGWCPLQLRNEHAVMNGIENGAYFYFVHSYALPLSADTLASANHAQSFAAVIAKDNFVAAQFHPERSSASGSRLLDNFLQWNP
jgi:glutamine amidotransferase